MEYSIEYPKENPIIEKFMSLVDKRSQDIYDILLQMGRRGRDKGRGIYKQRDNTDIKNNKDRFSNEEQKKSQTCCQCGRVSKVLIGGYCPDCV